MSKTRMKELIKQLNEATEAYDAGKPYMSDEKWDDMYFELASLEKTLGYTLPDSPTQKIIYKKVSELKKVKHNHPMLSLDKTKSLNDVKSFIGKKRWIAMAKMDGLSCSLTYKEGKLIRAETRGNGIEGEDITHNAMVIPSIPKRIPFEKGDEFTIDGEIICTYKDFKPFKEKYKNPRNFASGSIRLLDSKECEKRHLTFVAWDDFYNNYLYNYSEHTQTLCLKLFYLIQSNFEVVPYFTGDSVDYIEGTIDFIKAECKKRSYPIDGIVFKYDNIAEYEAAGRTDHHFKGGLAYKFYDEEYETEVKDIEWTMGRSGQLTPVLIYNDIDIEGSICNRASLHNISIMKDTMGEAYPGQRVFIYRANQIVPQVANVQTNNPNDIPTFNIPSICPYCGEPTEIRKDNESEVLYCTNPNCNGKLINRLDHFCGKKGLDIKGLSKKTLEKLIDWGWINSLKDIFKLQEHRTEWIDKSGFGIASVDKILSAIEESKKCPTAKFIAAIGIPQIGKVASEELIRVYGTYDKFREAVSEVDKSLYDIKGIGEVMIETLCSFDYTEADKIFDNYITEMRPAVILSIPATETKLNGKVFVITGKLKTYKNRNELKSVIEQNGGKVTDSVSKNTSYLINNDIESTSSKNKKAKELNIPIITEEDFSLLII